MDWKYKEIIGWQTKKEVRMKNTLLVLALVALVGCSNDDDPVYARCIISVSNPSTAAPFCRCVTNQAKIQNEKYGGFKNFDEDQWTKDVTTFCNAEVAQGKYLGFVQKIRYYIKEFARL